MATDAVRRGDQTGRTSRPSGVRPCVAISFAQHLPLTILEPPLALPDFTMSLVWHERRDADPGHAWLRKLLATCGPAAA